MMFGNDDFFRCFENFFNSGCEPFFRMSSRIVSDNIPMPSVRNVHRSYSRNPNWSVAHALGRDGRTNSTPVTVNNDRLQWFDSYQGRSLAPLPNVPARSAYLSKEELNLIRTEVYTDETGDDVCDICLERLKKGIKVKVLPCKHWYHGPCIDQWLLQRPVCPKCRAGVRAGLRKQVAAEKKNQRKFVNNYKNKSTNLTDEEFARRRKIINERYLKQRQQRLKKIPETSSNSRSQAVSRIDNILNSGAPKFVNNDENKTSSLRLQNNGTEYKENNESSSEAKPVGMKFENNDENRTNNLSLQNSGTEYKENNESSSEAKAVGMNEARHKAVLAALKRLEVNSVVESATEEN